MVVVHKYTQFYDIETKTDGFSVFTVTAGGQDVKRRLAPFFGAYKNFKLGAVKVKCVPAATLPVDPTGLSYEAGENTVDPRDMFNPGLVRITNGENIGDIFNLYGAPGMMNQYYSMMLDPRWYKFRLQEGFSRVAKPLVYNIVEPAQDVYPGRIQAYCRSVGDSSDKPQTKLGYQQTSIMNEITPLSGGKGTPIPEYEWMRKRVLMQNEQVPLGWMPTDAWNLDNPSVQGSPSSVGSSTWGSSPVPEVDLITFIFPQAFKTKFYYRLFIETTVMFKDPVVIDPIDDMVVLPTDRYIYSPLVNREAIMADNQKSELTPFDVQGGIQ